METMYKERKLGVFDRLKDPTFQAAGIEVETTT